jgi:hypothetical protein
LAANEPFADNECLLVNQIGGKSKLTSPDPSYPEQISMVPHPRTIRKAGEQVRFMVIDGFSIPRIRSYLSAWSRWWVRTSQSFSHQTLLTQFIHSCYDTQIAAIAAEVLLINDRASAGLLGLPVLPDLSETA